MDRLADVTLIKITYEADAIGQLVEAEEATRTLLASLHSITRQEWQNAAQQGLQAEKMAKLNCSDDYQEEELAEISGVRYSIYRTYETDDGGIELYLRRDTGPNLS